MVLVQPDWTLEDENSQRLTRGVGWALKVHVRMQWKDKSRTEASGPPTLQASWPWTSSPPSFKKIKFYCLQMTQSMLFCYSSPKGLRYTFQVVTTKNGFKHCQIYPGGKKITLVEKYWSRMHSIRDSSAKNHHWWEGGQWQGKGSSVLQ